MIAAEKRAMLRRYMSVCPACMPDEADAVPDDELDKWLTSHGYPETPAPDHEAEDG